MQDRLHGVHVFTSFSYSYLLKSIVLAETLKRFNRSWKLWAIISDRKPAELKHVDLGRYFDFVIHIEEWKVPLAWIFKHDVIELCTAVKGMALRRLLQLGAEKVFYLDPDIAVLSNLSELERELDQQNLLLTPHQLSPNWTPGAIQDNEICSLKHGVYNLGFLGVANTPVGSAFARWWESRLQDYCYSDIPEGLFTDQRWCDLAPSFFDGVKIHKDPGCNVSGWNLSTRSLRQDSNGGLFVDGSPLKFYHFSKLGELGFLMTSRYAGNNIEPYALWYWYNSKIRDASEGLGIESEQAVEKYWYFSTFEDGSFIPKEARTLYRKRVDLQLHFKNPFAEPYRKWYVAQAGSST